MNATSDREPFVAVPVWVMLTTELTAEAKATYGFFAELVFRTRSDVVEMSLSQLCAALKISKPTLLKRVAELETVGAITVEREWSDQHNRKVINRYTVHQRPFGEDVDSDVYRQHAEPHSRRQTRNITPPKANITPGVEANITPPVGGQAQLTRGSQRGLTEKNKNLSSLETSREELAFRGTKKENTALAASQLADPNHEQATSDQLASVTAIGRQPRPADAYFDVVRKYLANADKPAMAAKVAHQAIANNIDLETFEQLCRVLRGISPKAATAPNMVKVLNDPNHEARLKLGDVADHLDQARTIVLELRDNDTQMGADPYQAQLVFAELLHRRWTSEDIATAAADTSTWTVATLGITRDRNRKAAAGKPWEPQPQPRPAYFTSLDEREPLPEPSEEERDRVLAQMEEIQRQLQQRRRAG